MLGLAAWFQWLTAAGLTALLESVLKHFPQPLTGAYALASLRIGTTSRAQPDLRALARQRAVFSRRVLSLAVVEFGLVALTMLKLPQALENQGQTTHRVLQIRK